MNAAIKEKQPLTPGDMIARLREIREERRQISDRDSELVEEWRNVEGMFLRYLDEQGMTKASSDSGTASISEEVVPMTDNWDEFIAYVQQEQAFHLIQRRVATGAYREMLQSGQEVPGLKPFVKRSISLRATR